MANLNYSPPSNSYLEYEELSRTEAKYPLEVKVCEHCWLAQVAEYKKHNEIFDSNYAYFSSYSKSWLEHCLSYVENITNFLKLDMSSYVVEIASNDGYLLQYFKDKNIPCLGIEPTASTAFEAKKKGIDTLEEFFTEKLAKSLCSEGLKADLILGNNVLAHVPDINDFVAGFQHILHANGTVTMEFPHILQLLQKNQFDTIYHEHFSYLSLYSVIKVFTANNLKIYDVEEIPTHGGSLRIYASHANNDLVEISKRVEDLIALEKKAGLKNQSIYSGFQSKIDKIKESFLEFLMKSKSLNKKIAAYGAAAKGNTLINYCEISTDLIEFVADASPYKRGKYLPGSHIPIVSETKIREVKPDYIIILPWNIKEEIILNLSYVREWGGKFVIAIPELTII